MPTETITTTETELLAFCERKIQAGISTFCEVGDALLKIRDARLYRATHASFAAYCREKWNLSRAYVHEIIVAVETKRDLPDNLSSMLDNPRQAAALAKVAPEDRADVLKEVAAAGPVTAKAIKAAASKRSDAEEPPRVKCGLPDDVETREYRFSLKLLEITNGCRDALGRLNLTDAQLVQAAVAFRKLASDLERSKQA